MEEISFESFRKKIFDKGEIINYIINLKEGDYLDLNNITKPVIKISNCIFKNLSFKIIGDYEEEDEFQKLTKNIQLKNCSFEGLSIAYCTASTLSIENIDTKNYEIRIENCLFDDLNIFSLKDFNSKIFIRKTQILNKAIFAGLNFKEKGMFSILNCTFKNSTNIIESKFNNIDFTECSFLGNFDFYKNNNLKEINTYYFNDCVFGKTNFKQTNFAYSNEFKNCTFLKSSSFNQIKDFIRSEIYFENCSFEKLVDFNYSSIHKIEFIENNFEDIASFQNTMFDEMTIDRTLFEKGVLFDDIQIQKIDNCDRRTIRTIKQELQKKENKIDYNRFRVYEFNAYKKDIQKKLLEFKNDKHRFNHRKREPIQLKSDLFVLNISEIVSDYGTDWKRALKFTVLSGLTAFTLFFVFENLDKSFNFNNWQDFIFGYLRFFLITDFKNEYYNAGESILKFNCFLSLIPFILGKIAVAFGIYEMIQSFRKFKA